MNLIHPYGLHRMFSIQCIHCIVTCTMYRWLYAYVSIQIISEAVVLKIYISVLLSWFFIYSPFPSTFITHQNLRLGYFSFSHHWLLSCSSFMRNSFLTCTELYLPLYSDTTCSINHSVRFSCSQFQSKLDIVLSSVSIPLSMATDFLILIISFTRCFIFD